MSLGRGGARRRRHLTLVAAAVAAAAAFLPFARGVAAGHVLYFRDLAILFYPYRQYAAEGLRMGQLRYWDPFVHEGVPLLYPPAAYPVDLLHALWPDTRWFSLLLALHVPLAAAAMVLLGRRFGLSPIVAAAGGVFYALGGFLLSNVNVYFHAQAAAWAPLAILGLRSAAQGRRRGLVGGAMAVAIMLSTIAVEIALQGIVIGLILAWRPRRWRGIARAVLATALGGALAAPSVLVMRANMAAGERAHGFPVEVVLNQSIHPFTLVQVVVANLYGDLARLPDHWWGSNFFDRGFPFILSLYLGPTVVVLAATALCVDRRRTRRLAAVALVFLIVSLGRWGGLGTLLEMVPESWRMFRYPTKAFFGVHLSLALLAAVGVRAISRRAMARRVFVALALLLGAILALAPILPRLAPSAAAWFVGHFFPPAVPTPTRLDYFADLLADASRGGLLALAAALVGGLALLGRLDARLGGALVAAIAAGDLLRAGAGLNPMSDPSVLGTSPEVMATLRGQQGLQRLFTCHPEASRAYWRARALRPQSHEALTLAAWADTLTPALNRPAHLPSALGEDLTSLVPLSRLLPSGAGCGDIERLVPWLRGAGVSHVLSLDPISGAGLQPVADVAVPRLSPLHVFVAAVSAPVPLRFVAASVRAESPPAGAVTSPERAWVEGAPEDVDGARGSVRSLLEEPDHVELEVQTTRPTALIVLDGSFPGWRATLDGRAVPILRAGHHRAVWVPAGTSRVRMDYRPRGLRAGLALSVLAALGLGALSASREAKTPRQKSGS